MGVQMTNRTLNDVPFSEDVSADVLRERAAAYDCAPDGDHPIVVRDLRKTFPAMDGNPKKIAVANMSLKIPKGECFGCVPMRRVCGTIFPCCGTRIWRQVLQVYRAPFMGTTEGTRYAFQGESPMKCAISGTVPEGSTYQSATCLHTGPTLLLVSCPHSPSESSPRGCCCCAAASTGASAAHSVLYVASGMFQGSCQVLPHACGELLM